MFHSIVSWDCCFRNFHHLIDGLLNQSYPADAFELIFVEQRSREASDRYNHIHRLPSLGDRLEKEKGRINFRVIYLNEPPDVPYHLGKCNNAGIAAASGDLISVMDGDQLLPPDFLTRLSDFFRANPSAVVSVYRKMARYPIGVWSYREWMRADNSFNGCLPACADRYKPLPKVINNYGPMISASRKLWKTVGGYDPAPIWSTFLTTAGADAARRLSIAGGSKPEYLPDSFVVHPWHPVAVDTLRREGRGKRLLDLQRELTEFSVRYHLPHYRDRADFSAKLHEANSELIEGVLNLKEVIDDLQMEIPRGEFLKERINCWAAQIGTRVAGIWSRS